MSWRRFSAAFAMILLLAGAGCAPLRTIKNALIHRPWFHAPSHDAAAAAKAIQLGSGLLLTVRPSTLGLTGSVEEALGNEDRALHVTVRAATPETSLVLEWKDASATGTLALSSYQDAEAMLLPAFWPAGEAEARRNGGIWMSRAAFAKLDSDGSVEWRFGLAEQALSIAAKAFKTFHELASTLAGSSTSTAPVSPFTLKKTGTSETFPLLVDHRLELVRVVRAESWLADVFILDNPDNPLIVKLVMHAAAQPALKALGPSFARWNELGYEITSLSRP